MKNLAIVLAVISLSLSCITIGVCGIFGMLQFSSYSEYQGQLEYIEEEQQLVLNTLDGEETIALSFYYDEASDLVIDDFQEVKVKGYFNRTSNKLEVLEIGDVESVTVL